MIRAPVSGPHASQQTKEGEAKGKDKNSDAQIEDMLNAFKSYASKHGLHWAFVRDKDNRLYINNTEFVMDMSDEHWVPLTLLTLRTLNPKTLILKILHS